MPPICGTVSSGLALLTARDALTPEFKRVQAKSRPGLPSEDLVFGVFDDEDRFLGLAHPKQVDQNPSVEFSELIHHTHHPSVMADKTLSELRPLFRNADDRVVVVDEAKKVIGAITFTSLFNCINDYLLRMERQSSQRAPGLTSMVFDVSQAGMLITDSGGRILAVNPAFTAISGYTQEEVLGENPSILASGKQPPDFYQKMYTSLAEHDTWEGEIINRRKSGSHYAEWLRISAVRDADGQVSHYIGSFFDISDIKRISDEVHHLTFYDPLTHLPNRQMSHRKLKEKMFQARHRRKSLAMMFMDLDNFKSINDSYGHHIGDLVLQEVASRIAGCIRRQADEPESDLISRQGGDEFTMIIHNIDSIDEAKAIARRIIKGIHKPMMIQGLRFFISVSIGLAVYPSDAETMEELLSCADSAMYEAKKAGKNCYRLFCSQMADLNRRAYRLRVDLNDALKKQQFHLVFQPRVTMPDGVITSFEALLRWRHPELGEIPPDEFIPLLEESTVADQVEDWVLDASVRQCATWNDSAPHPIGVSINITARQLMTERFARQVNRFLNAVDLPHNLLEIEITERVAIRDISKTRKALKLLREFDVCSSLDDFGTGYSSLSYLTDFDFSTIKIDKSFVSKIENSERDRNLVKAILGIGRSLDMRVVAEGVENTIQLDFLINQYCHEFQGFLFSRPISINDVPPLLTQRRWGAMIA